MNTFFYYYSLVVVTRCAGNDIQQAESQGVHNNKHISDLMSNKIEDLFAFN